MNPGSRIGPYEIIASIGAGGMGEVLRARDTQLSRDVAIKILPAAFAKDQDRVARFKREAQILASLHHPNIAAIYGLEDDPATGLLALIMEFIDGEDLAARLRRGPLPVDDAVTIAKQIAEGLEEAHEHGVVHRDLKPANVKVTPDGKVKVLDFGLAKALDSALGGSSNATTAIVNSPTMTHQESTASGLIIGTAPYMSPEQARGRKVDKRADIWSFGVVFFEMLSGRRMFRGETMSDTLAAVLRDDIPWNTLPSDVPAGARHLLRRCLERDPSKRLRDIGEARVMLDGSATTMIEAAPASESGVAPARREMLRLGLVATAGAAAGAALRGWFLPRAPLPAVAGLVSKSLTGSGTVISASISPDGKFIAYVESEQGQQSLWLQQIQTSQTLRLIPARTVGYWGHTFMRDGNAIVFGLKTRDDPKGSLFSIPTIGGTPRRLLGDIDSPPAYSPDGRRMVFCRREFPDANSTSVIVASSDGSDEKTLASFQQPERVAGIFFGGPAGSPDGASIATAVVRSGREGKEARAWLSSIDVKDGRVTKIADPGWDRAAQCDFLPDGRSLLIIAATPQQRDGQLWKVSLPDGAARAVTSDVDDHRIISLTSDGTKLATVVGDNSSVASIATLPDTSHLRRIGRGRQEGIGGVALTKDHAVFASPLGNNWAITSVSLDGSLRETLLKGKDDERFSGIAATSGGDIFFNAQGTRGREVRRLRPGSPTAERIADSDDAIAVSLDGRLLFYSAVTSAGLRLFRHDLQTNEARPLVDVPAFLPAVDAAARRVAFYMNTPNGFRIAMCSVDGGPLLIDIPAEPVSTGTAAAALGARDLYINSVRGDRSNVWAIPLKGGEPHRLTNFTEQTLFDFAISDDEKTLVVVRGPRVRDAQLVTGF